MATPDVEGGSSPPVESANPFGAPPPATEAMDPSLFAAPAADSYAPAGTGTQGHTDSKGEEVEDARVGWRAKNAKLLEEREAKEKASNEEAKAKASEWLQKFYSDRDTRISKAKEDNLAQETAATKGPKGDTDWEKVNSMIDFTFKPPQETESERERFKGVLFAAKEKNVPVLAK